MPLAAAHIIPAIIIFNRLKDKPFFKQYLKPNALAIAAIGSLLPDIDILLNWILKPSGYSLEHGTYTHTLLFAFLFFLPAAIFAVMKKYKFSIYLFIAAGGTVLHLLLDYIIGGGGGNGVMWLYPFSEQTYKIHLLSKIPIENAFEGLDAIILLTWIYFKSPILYQNK